MNTLTKYYSQPQSLVLKLHQCIYSILFPASEPCPQATSMHLINIIPSLRALSSSYINAIFKYYSQPQSLVLKYINAFIKYYSQPVSPVLKLRRIYSISPATTEVSPQADFFFSILINLLHTRNIDPENFCLSASNK